MTDKGMTGRRMTGKRMADNQLSPPSSIRLPVIRLSVIRLSVIRLSVIRLSVIRLSVIRLSVIRLSVIRLSVIRASSEPCAGAFSCSVCPKRPQGLPGGWHLQTAGSHEGARFRCTPDLWVSGGCQSLSQLGQGWARRFLGVKHRGWPPFLAVGRQPAAKPSLRAT